MSFTLQTTDMDLGDTPIENIFINDYMPMANGTYVKVYLLGYKYAHDRDGDIEVNNTTIAKHLEIPLEDVLSAWDFWEEKGIIEKIADENKREVNYQVRFLNLKQLYIKNNINLWIDDSKTIKSHAYDPQGLVDANKVPEINNMFNNIDYILRKQTVPNEKRKILDWIHDYNMNPDVIEKAVYYSVEQRGVRSLNYIEAIVRNWNKDGLTNMEALMEHFKESDEKFYRYQRIMKSLGLDKRPIREEEKGLIDIWFGKWDFSLELVLHACEQDKNPTPSVTYVNGIIKSWNEKGIRSIEDVGELDKKRKETKQRPTKAQAKKGQANVTRFHNFEQRTDKYSSDELEDIAKRKRDAYVQRVKGDN